MVTREVNWLNASLLCLLFFLGTQISIAQYDSIPGKDYSYLNFNAVQDFYNQHGLSLINADNADLYFEIYDWKGTPYQYGGRSKRGVDCSDFVSVMYERIYNKKAQGSCTDIYKKTYEIDVSQLTEGDLVFFSIRSYMSHVGLYLGNNKFAHATVHGGVMVSDLEEPYYKKHFLKAARFSE